MKTVLIHPADRLGLSRPEAAEYIGVGVTLFDEMVEDGRMPSPKRVNSRTVWSRFALEKAFTRLPDDRKSKDDVDEWSEATA